MSLINDALKQTQQVQPKTPPPSPPPLSPIESTPHEGLGWLVPGIVILLVVTASVLIGLSLFKPVPLAASALPVAHTPPVVAPATPAMQQVEPVAVAPPVVTNAVSAPNSVAVIPPKPPEPKLQGILFSATRPCAIVSGRTVYVGDRINKFRVKVITRESITLQSDTETKVLSLNPQ